MKPPRAPGLYILHWKTGGFSLGVVGILHDGTRWMACANWTAKTDRDPVQSTDWNAVERAELVATRSLDSHTITITVPDGALVEAKVVR